MFLDKINGKLEHLGAVLQRLRSALRYALSGVDALTEELSDARMLTLNWRFAAARDPETVATVLSGADEATLAAAVAALDGDAAIKIVAAFRDAGLATTIAEALCHADEDVLARAFELAGKEAVVKILEAAGKADFSGEGRDG